MTKEQLSNNLNIAITPGNNFLRLEFYYKEKYLCENDYYNRFIIEEERENFIDRIINNYEWIFRRSILTAADILKEIAKIDNQTININHCQEIDLDQLDKEVE